MYQKRKKIIASMLIFMLTITHLSIIKEVLATSLESQTIQTNNANVEFDVYFTNGDKKEHSAIKNIGEENYINTLVNVKTAGYLKNAVITADNANFKILETSENKQIAKIENDKIYLNQIKSGNTVEIAIPIEMEQKEEIALEEFSKENALKLTATYVDGNGKEKQIEKEITVKLSWTKEKQAELSMQVSKFVPYDINSNKGVLLQTLVKSYLKDNVLPVKENKIEIEVPTINNIKPQEIKVLANTTKATNGDETGKDFNSTNYTYDELANKLIITVKNEVTEQGKVSWKKDAQDEFVINYIYKEEALNSITEESTEIKINANSALTVYEASQTKVSKTFEAEATLKDQVGNLVDFEITTNVETLSKGQIYANYQTTNKIETEYKQIISANIGNAELTDKIVLEQNVDNFVTEADTKAAENETYYKTIIVDKNEFNKILGEDGKISFYLGTTEIAKIDKETQADKQGKIELNLSELNINSLKIETSKPQTEGKLNFEIVKTIKGDVSYSKIEMKSFNALELNLSGKAQNGDVNFVEQSLTKKITFTEPTSQAELLIDKTNLSTIVTNENVKITAILKTDTLDCNLYQDPTLAITLPSYIENINIKNIEVLFDTEGSKLTLNGHQVVVNADGTKTILVTLKGTQTEYTLGAISKGLNVVITSDITVNKLTPNKQEQITMVYTNNNVITNQKARTVTQDTNQVVAPVTFVAPTGVITTTAISNYKEGAETLTSISGEEKVATIETIAEARNATFTMNLINNYNNTIDTISILGRTPFAGNKNIVTKEDLSSTITMPLTSNITVSNVDAAKVAIYYSENAEATKDLNAVANGWTLTPSALANVKSYLIVITDYTMNTADTISFTYDAQIPANLQHNQSAYETYVAYFNNNLDTGKVEDKAVATKIGVTTGKGPVIEASLSSNVKETEQVLSGKIIKYTLTVKNTGTVDAQNVMANVEIPTNLTYVEEDTTSTLGYKFGQTTITEIENTEEDLSGTTILQTAQLNLGTILVGEQITKEIWLKANDITEETETVEVKAKITSDNVKKIETNSVKNNIKKAYYRTSAVAAASNYYVIKENATYKMVYTVKSTESEVNRTNTILTITLPSELNYESIKLTKFNEQTYEYDDITSEANVKFDKSSKKITINIGEVDGGRGKEIEITTTVGTLPQNVYEQEINIEATIKGDNTPKEAINTIKETVNKPGLQVTQTASIPSGNKIAVGEGFKYVVEIKNLSNITMDNITLTDYLPKELIYQFATITYESGLSTTSTKVTEEGNPVVTLNLEPKSSVKVELGVVADIVANDTKVENTFKIEHSDIATIQTEIISHIIEKYSEEITNPNEDATKRIMGQVWKDENGDGIKDESEAMVSDVEVMLFNNQTGNLVTDNEGNVLRAKTNENGQYTFSAIKQGKYTVIFLYDTANYSATVYRKENVDDTKNSDAVDSKITLDGITRIAAITEEVAVTSTNIYNIDLGLISNPKFDLKLDKTVSKITVQNSTGTNVYEYNDSKLAKKDLAQKQINDTTIIVEYKITITNEGAISGYVKKIADYIPSEMKFNSELNRDWYVAENGTIYNSSLANALINPGETKVVTLTLTKKMTENNLGLYHNEAEIYEAYNDLGIEDVDSTPGNKVSNEDDISSADVLITVKTGETILFIGLTLTIIITIGIGAFFIKKKVLR